MIARASILAAFALAGCDANPGRINADPGGITTLAKWTDPETGCVYLFFDEGWGNTRVASLSIRFRADGKPDCPLKDQKPDGPPLAQP